MTDINHHLQPLLNKLAHYRALRDELGEIAEQQIAELERQIQTMGGAYVEGGVKIGGGGDFVGHDKIIIQQAMISITQPMMDANPKLDRGTLEASTEAYLQYIHDRHTFLTMKGIGPAESLSLQLRLLDLYVPLTARREIPEGETWERGPRAASARASQQRQGKPELLLEILKEQDGIVLLGDPGSGKTTFLKFLALKLARGEGGELGLAGRLPILLPLATYANALQKGDASLGDFIVEHFDQTAGNAPLGLMLSDALAAGKALILLDGLDEVHDSALRNTVAERVTDFYAAQRRKGNKLVLTSRVVGYRAVRLAAEGLAECTLTDFDDDEIAEFVARWTAAIEKQVGAQNAIARDDAEIERRELLESIHANAGIRQLAANPLLLTILALMKRKDAILPERRVQLYEQYIRTLVSVWNRARSLSGRAPGTAPGQAPSRDLDEVQTVRVLAPLALWMHQVAPGVGLVKRADIQRKLDEIFRERGEPDPESTARRFLDDLREHTALLLARSPEEYGFIHLTFEEYLAAVALGLAAQGDAQVALNELAPRIGDQAWREVTLLAVSYIGIVQNLPRVAGQIAAGAGAGANRRARRSAGVGRGSRAGCLARRRDPRQRRKNRRDLDSCHAKPRRGSRPASPRRPGPRQVGLAAPRPGRIRRNPARQVHRRGSPKGI
jgi:hypothetical protein